ncbi:MAG: DEAD/DEAH box helicase [Acidimicrobiia bacterium]|nr:DEAD/DEAH box helicase [Acidimicrobiia bacterium]
MTAGDIHSAGGYRESLGSAALASNCVFCRRPLLDVESIERGYGPICAEKYMLPHGEGGIIDDKALGAAMESAPPELSSALRAVVKSGDGRAIVNKAVWHASLAVSFPDLYKNSVVSCCQRIALACGFGLVSDRLKVFYLGKSDTRIKLVRQSVGLVAVSAPYLAALVSGMRGIPGRRWDGNAKRDVLPDSSLPNLLAVLSACYPGQLMDFYGEIVPIPLSVHIPPPKTMPAGAPTRATGDTGKVSDRIPFKHGDRVVDPSGKEKYVCWLKSTAGDQRIGLGDSPTQRGNLEFYGWGEVQLKPMAQVAKEEAANYQETAKDARAHSAPMPTPAAVKVRAIPEVAFPHQVQGIQWLDSVRHGLLADEPGLGKTMQACAAADARVLIVCPAAMRTDWMREMLRWRPEFMGVIVTSREPRDKSVYEKADFIVVNYDVLEWHADTLLQVEIRTLISDESHYVKTLKQSGNKKELSGSRRALALARLAKHVKHKRFLLTGTPIMNRAIELWPLLFLIDPMRWGSYVKFGVRYCAGKLKKVYLKGGGGKSIQTWDFGGRSNGLELHSILTSTCMLRRTKDILDLPEKTRYSIKVALDEKTAKTYLEAVADFAKWVKKNGGYAAIVAHHKAEVITRMTALRYLCAIGKIDVAAEWCVRHFDGTGRPLVVMAHHRDVTVGLAERLSNTDVESAEGTRKLRVGKILGGMSDSQRTDDKDAFQRGDLDVIVCSIQAAGVGLTLTAASDTLFVERTWAPAALVQAEDRIHRIGQKNKCVITYLDATGTIDDAIGTLLIAKQKTSACIIDGEDLDEDEAVIRIFGTISQAGGVTPNGRPGALPLVEWQSADVF